MSAVGRGFTKSGQGNPDEARAARFILKDYVNAKLLFCHAPPNISEDAFNEETHSIALKRAEGKKLAPTTHVVKGADTFVAANVPESGPQVQGVGQKSQRIDRDFFDHNANIARPLASGGARGPQAFSRAISSSWGLIASSAAMRRHRPTWRACWAM